MHPQAGVEGEAHQHLGGLARRQLDDLAVAPHLDGAQHRHREHRKSVVRLVLRRSRSGARVGLSIDGGQPLGRDMGIDLGCRQAGMTKQFLNGP